MHGYKRMDAVGRGQHHVKCMVTPKEMNGLFLH